tara:strand:- start:15 stop:323 length:309 start_codon:yes stop_codon:yes gene_type:complete
MISHHDPRRTPLNHIPYEVKSFPDSRSAIDNISNEDGLAPAMLVHTIYFAVTHLFKQSGKRVRAAMDIADNVVTTTCGMVASSHNQLADISLAQPSLSRQVA